MTLPPVLVVTGTDTGVGKTVVTAALAACLTRTRAVAVLKPAQTGVTADEPGDVDEVCRLAGVVSGHEGVRLSAPLAPPTAARRQGVGLPSVAAHAATVEALARSHDVVLVEGAGGLLVGLDDEDAGLPELARSLSVAHAFVVVARAGLGTLNHSRLTVEALRARSLPVAGLVIGSWPVSPGLAEQENVADLPQVTGVPLLGRLPAGAAGLDPSAFRAQAPAWFSWPDLGR